MSNDNNPVNQAPYFPPYGYLYYVPQGDSAAQGAFPPPQGWPPQPAWYPQMAPGALPPGYLPPGYPLPGYLFPGNAMPQAAHHHGHHAAPGMDWSAQAQGVVENVMGEQAGLLKSLISTIGADDKEFWKGAMIGAAVTLLLTNDSVRQTLTQTLTRAGYLLKTGGDKVKSSVASGAESVKESVAAGSTIFRDTVKAGKAEFQASVKRQRATASAPEETPNEQQP
ncbi:hypothetical protein CS369_01610 [Candidatus Symbiopectobacterium sp. 'North America']|uniref:YtxH domain-containing protein n=1 Tax=Candidatus Symbiopectobacterium sp. 'North America' TaxID=2794574 RepID=UPI0018CBA1E9|nr:YtxH domain-containing protein [Candidatus Symbiopectobacterium sp. 'North America']MBG6243870.1 hypothetical protein [Candidatus Symbiopectobacterium sp. 'North America']